MFHLVTGGSGSGKSEYAEQLITEFGEKEPWRKRYYLATMMPYGAETKQKIERHQRLRDGKGFCTIECYMDVKNQLAALFDEEKEENKPLVLLECMSNLTANELYEEKGAGENTAEIIMEGIRFLVDHSCLLVVVTNEVFAESVPDSPEMTVYKEVLGTINCRMAGMAELVTEVVYGIPVEVKR
ncbi:MAG: bifunctional adenosylcobinamide kinase/adenosylcobinamide-phosphate guanylyltransferase [Bariatricus sp.]